MTVTVFLYNSEQHIEDNTIYSLLMNLKTNFLEGFNSASQARGYSWEFIPLSRLVSSFLWKIEAVILLWTIKSSKKHLGVSRQCFKFSFASKTDAYFVWSYAYLNKKDWLYLDLLKFKKWIELVHTPYWRNNKLFHKLRALYCHFRAFHLSSWIYVQVFKATFHLVLRKNI